MVGAFHVHHTPYTAEEIRLTRIGTNTLEWANLAIAVQPTFFQRGKPTSIHHI